LTIVRENIHNYRFEHLGSLATAKLTLTTVRLGSILGVDRIGRQFGHRVATQNHQVAGAELQFGLAVPVRRSFQLTH
jgi:hypothetical protein